MLFLLNGESYTRYEKDSEGTFVADNGTTYKENYINTQTEEFLQYAEKSKEQFVPGMESSGKETVLKRNCLIYRQKVGISNTAVTYSLFVDKETGICLGWNESKTVAGHDLTSDG